MTRDWKYTAPPHRAGSDDMEMLTVETVDNHIYFYADVNSDRSLAPIQEVKYLDSSLRNEHTSRGLDNLHPLTPIWLHISSNGGDLFTGFSIADQLRMIKSPIYTIVEGVCASAATLIAMVGTERYILPSSFMMVHQLSGSFWGTHDQFQDEQFLQEMLMTGLVAFYEEQTRLDESQLRQMLSRNTWMNAEKCVATGFANKILTP